MKAVHAVPQIYVRPISVLYSHLHVDLVSYFFLSDPPLSPAKKEKISAHISHYIHIPIYLIFFYITVGTLTHVTKKRRVTVSSLTYSSI
jgi:hypothetical protein